MRLLLGRETEGDWKRRPWVRAFIHASVLVLFSIFFVLCVDQITSVEFGYQGDGHYYFL